MMARRIEEDGDPQKDELPERRKSEGAGLGLCLLLAAAFWAVVGWLVWG
ncbi:hypothetical protein SAMN06265173_13818 [Thalassovita litoralis]|jgi:hypothetical protein|uniref:Uncharacterized protein n=1 Tax=Thalassovita litoralis TaxID=1010611 RepID=A0A521FQE5_9RHOB|nr:hypothetical protein SAMN06265173_13818 [Thalassovita litoralis]